MSWGIKTSATEKEKIFAEYNDSLKGMNSADGLAYHHYSQIYDLGRGLADKEYQQGIKDFAKWLSEQGYLTQIEYDMNEDFEGNIIWSEFETPMNTEDVVAEYFQQLKENK